MLIEQDAEKVLQKTDVVLTNAGYEQLEKQKTTTDASGDANFDDVILASEDSVEFSVSPFDDDTGIPVGLRESPLG